MKMKKFWREWRTTALIGFGILVFALGLRLCNLTILPVFADESIYIRWAQIMVNEPTLRFLPLSDGKQPLFMWVLMFLVNRFSDPLFIGRLMSVATGIGTITGIFALSYILFRSKTVSLIAAFIWAVSPFGLFFDRMALVDSMLTMFGVCVLFWGILTARTKRLDMAILTGFALGLASLTKSPAIFFAILLPTTWIFSSWPKTNKKRVVHLIKLASLLLVVYSIAFGMYSIQRLGPNFHLLSSRTGDYVFPLSHLWTNPKDPFIFHFQKALEWIWIWGPGAVVILILSGISLNFKKYRKEILLLVVWSLFPILVQTEFAKAFTSRYILFSIPPLYILAASVFATKKESVKKLMSLVFVVFVIQAFWFDALLLIKPEKAPIPQGDRSGYLEEWTAGLGTREIAELIKKEHDKEPGAKIVIGAEGNFGTPLNALEMYLEGVENVLIIGIGSEIREIPNSLLESKKSGNKTYMVANSSRMKFKGNYQDHGLEIISLCSKAIRKIGTKEFKYLGPREALYFFEVTERALSKK